MATNPSAGNMLANAFKRMIGSIIKVLALFLAWCIELLGKILFKISEIIKNNAK